jgi:trk system potassium uptake protein TrkA
MYVIIVGAGDIGTPLIELAIRSGNEVVVVERDEAKADEIASVQDCLVIHGDATTKDVLRDAGADRADAIVSTTDDDATNVMVCLLAEEFDIPSAVSVVHNPEHMNVFRQIGVNTIENPQRLIAEYLYRAAARPAIVDYMRIAENAEVFEIVVADGAPIAGMTLEKAGEAGLLPEETLIVAIEREELERPLTPRGTARIEAGDLVTVYSAFGASPELTDVFGHDEDRTES